MYLIIFLFSFISYAAADNTEINLGKIGEKKTIPLLNASDFYSTQNHRYYTANVTIKAPPNAWIRLNGNLAYSTYSVNIYKSYDISESNWLSSCQSSPSDCWATGNSDEMLILFRTNNLSNLPTYFFTVTAISNTCECGGTVNADTQQTLQSPQFPYTYCDHDFTCDWTANTDNSTFVTITMDTSDFNLLSKNSLQILDTDGSNIETCTTSMCSPRTSLGKQMKFTYKYVANQESRNGWQLNGFKLVANGVDDAPQGTQNCKCPDPSKTMLKAGESATLTSANFPQPYCHNTQCSKTIRTDDNNVLTINFDSFALSTSSIYDKDSLVIYSGDQTNNNPIQTCTGKLCSYSKSWDPSVTFNFAAAYDNSNAKGYSALITAVPTTCKDPSVNQLTTNTFVTATFSPPSASTIGYYPSSSHYFRNQLCKWKFIAPASTSDSISSTTYNVIASTQYCYNLIGTDSITFYDGPDENSPKLKTLSASSSECNSYYSFTSTVTSTGQNMFVVFQSDNTGPKKYFSFDVQSNSNTNYQDNSDSSAVWIPIVVVICVVVVVGVVVTVVLIMRRRRQTGTVFRTTPATHMISQTQPHPGIVYATPTSSSQPAYPNVAYPMGTYPSQPNQQWNTQYGNPASTTFSHQSPQTTVSAPNIASTQYSGAQ